MSVLLDERIPRTLPCLIDEWCRPERAGFTLEAWLFEDEESRQSAERDFARAGIAARVRSAYKPLVHAFLEDIATDALARVTIRYPVVPQADEIRFLAEAYPLAALFDGVEMHFERGGESLAYEVTVEYSDGRVAHYTVFAPNRLRPNLSGGNDLSPTGWLRVVGFDGRTVYDDVIETEIEQVFTKAMAAVAAHEWPTTEPFMERLALDVRIAGIERPLAYGDEVMSTREALHEDLYFSILEFFKHRSGRAHEDRGLQPGQIVPDIRAGSGDAHLRIALQSFGSPQLLARAEQDLEAADAAPGLVQIARELGRLPGERFRSFSREGRPVPGLYRSGSRPALLITAGQHANEVSGPVGALRAVRRLLDVPEAHIALIPVENPDGYDLHGRLCEANPRHMHHAARYTSLGCDVDFGPTGPAYEIGARRQALALSGAQLHVNLHGYPAHEWTRPFTGYLPRGFETWSLPKGFLLIMRHHPAWQAVATALVEQVALELSAVPGLADFNRRQMEAWAAHSGREAHESVHGIPCIMQADTHYPTPLMLITEFPDETVTGEAFRFAHTVQMAAVLAAEAAFARIGQPSA